MKVTGPSRAGATAASRKTAGAAGAKSGFRLGAAGAEPAGVEGSKSPSALQALDALIGLQSEGARSRGALIAAGRQALVLLDKVRQGIVEGRILPEDLEALAQSVTVETARCDEIDPELRAIYDEIVLRARVELAKLGR